MQRYLYTEETWSKYGADTEKTLLRLTSDADLTHAGALRPANGMFPPTPECGIPSAGQRRNFAIFSGNIPIYIKNIRYFCIQL